MSTYNFNGPVSGHGHNFGDHGVQNSATAAAPDVHALLDELLRTLQANRTQVVNADGIEEHVQQVRAELASPAPDRSRLRALGGGIVQLAAGVGSLADVVGKILQAVQLI